MSDEQPVFYTVREVAEILALSTRTIHRYLDSGDLACHRMGRAIRISAEALDAYLASHEVVARVHHETLSLIPGKAPVRVRQGSKVAAKLTHEGQKVLSPGVFNIAPRRAKKGL